MTGMDERPLHEQVEAMKDDPDAWGEPVAAPERKPRSERRQRGAVISVRLSAEELELIQAHADLGETPLSTLLRESALEAARRSSEPAAEVAQVTYLQAHRSRNATYTYTAGQISRDTVVTCEG